MLIAGCQSPAAARATFPIAMDEPGGWPMNRAGMRLCVRTVPRCRVCPWHHGQRPSGADRGIDRFKIMMMVNPLALLLRNTRPQVGLNDSRQSDAFEQPEHPVKL